MLKIGITGNIGSGKTTVCKMFELLGVPVFYADVAAKEAMSTDAELMAEIKQAFGEESYINGELDRKHIAAIVFNDEAQLAKLNSLVHPATFRAFDTWVASVKNAPYLIKEAAILFESGSFKFCDHSLLVTAPSETRIARVTRRDKISRADVEAREARQFSEEKKKELADYQIANDDTCLVIPQVLDLHQTFLKLAEARS